MMELGIQHNPGEWRIFIDSSKTSLKDVLLNSGNKLLSVPFAHAVDKKETYESMTVLLEGIKYKKHGWQMCCDLKMVALLLGLLSGFTKYCCFLCLRESRDTKKSLCN
jgi:hypothetical protein